MPVRIYEISKKWGIKSVDLLDRLAELGIEAASHMTAIADEDVAILAKDIVRRPIKPGKKSAAKRAAAKKEAAKAAKDKKGAEKDAGAAATAVVEEPPTQVVAEKAPQEPVQVAPAAEHEAAVAQPVEPKEAPPAVEAAPAVSAEAQTVEAPHETLSKEADAAARKGAARKVHKEPEKVVAVDEAALKEQMVVAAEIAAKEAAEESRILRRIILPPRRKPRKKHKGPVVFEPAAAPRPIVPVKPQKVEFVSPVSVRDFSQTSGVKTTQVLKKLIDLGMMANVNSAIPDETAELLGMEFGIEITIHKGYDPEDVLRKLEEPTTDAEKLLPRFPVVALLGHVDHGKTSLLDAIRHSDVAAGEHGGITQHIGAYRVTTDSGHTLTFLDTPGHEAFTEMRARGANVTDIVILVIAADDGVMPQTVEAVNHAKAANVPIVVAVNKIDKPEAQTERVKRQLTTYELLAEEWGGETIFAPVSAVTGEGVEHLLEMLALQAEILELKADPSRPALGTVLEARRTEGRGIVVTVLVQQGTLRPGDVMLAGSAFGRLRFMMDEHAKIVREARPSMPVEVSGFGQVPDAGDRFYVLDDIGKAREIAERRAGHRREQARTPRRHVSLENLMETMRADGAKELRLVLKADVQGSLEVLNRTLSDLSIPEVVVRVIHAGIGGINESDVLLADASDAIIVGFNVVAEQAARAQAERKSIDVRLYNVIYHVVEEMKAALENRLDPEFRQVIRGHAEVRDTFKVSRIGTIAGCMITDGVVTRKSSIRIARGGIVMHEGTIESLRHFKDDVREVREGFECGIKLAGFDDIKVGDVIEAYETEVVARKLT